MPGSTSNNLGTASVKATTAAANAESESNRIVLAQAALAIGRIQGLLTRIPAPVRGGTR